MTDENNKGGFLVPKIAYVEHIKDGLCWSLLFSLSRKIMNFGIRLQSICMYQEEIHPYNDIIRLMEESRIFRDKNG